MGAWLGFEKAVRRKPLAFAADAGLWELNVGGRGKRLRWQWGSLFASNVNLGLGRTLKKTALVDLERSDLRFQSRRWNAQSGSCAGCS